MKSRRSSRPSPPPNKRVGERAKRRRYRHVLDVQIPSSKRERQIHWRQRTLGALRIGGLVAAVALLVVGARTVVARALQRGESLLVSDLSVRTNGALSRGRILDQARVAPGDHLLRIDLHAVRDRLEKMPQVASARISRQLPGRISIAVEERVPLAWLDCPAAGVVARNSENGFLVDSGGLVYRCEVVRQSDFNLPVIRLADPSRIKHGVVLGGDEATAAMEIVRLSRRLLPGAVWSLTGVELINSYSVRAVFANDAETIFGTSGGETLERQFVTLARVAAEGERLGKAIESANLLPERNIPVTFFGNPGPAQEPGAGPEAAPAAAPDRRARSVRGILGRP